MVITRVYLTKAICAAKQVVIFEHYSFDLSLDVIIEHSLRSSATLNLQFILVAVFPPCLSVVMIHLKKNLLDRISSISIGSSNVQPSELPYLPVLFIGMSQSRQHDKSESVLEDSPCLKPFFDSKHELLASVYIFLRPKPCVQTRIYPVDLEFFDPVVQCFIDLLQSAVAELVDLIESHDHLNLIFVPKCDGSWRVNDCVVVLVLKACSIPARFGEV
ncbi:hypothetical protein Tco_1080972 [Tanacetum coccineum]|uniref:Uncharacterized protein n=1 Tax=Tanacetum coccineum TaxID=301880 RepID=A0ABQ5HXV0_9ASTR